MILFFVVQLFSRSIYKDTFTTTLQAKGSILAFHF